MNTPTIYSREPLGAKELLTAKFTVQELAAHMRQTTWRSRSGGQCAPKAAENYAGVRIVASVGELHELADLLEQGGFWDAAAHWRREASSRVPCAGGSSCCH